ncbi:SLBB domain-containing protein [Faecalicatena contorta]|uniref:SLBB domain-containing protein n=1 Tax=Faecalicatena contorta TaxID=39482 RepID=UPI001F3A0EB9|nr:SLBB domain-containing protein [Faecalicatena contorta]MCF2555416.1 SLBB domain-containing protein [Faecalicatena contorta]
MNESMLEKIRQAGVVGAGGAGFPTHVKLKCDAEYVIVNCAECEPLIKSDKYLMEQHGDVIVDGLCSAMECVGAKHGVLAVKHKNKEAVKSLEAAISGKKNVEIHLLDNYYPAGDEQQIIYEVTKRTIPVGKLPIEAGCVVVNAQTAYHIAQAMMDKPVTGRNVTVTGAVRSPLTVNVPIGTAVPYLLELAGGVSIDNYVIVVGGPLMGRVADDPGSEFVTKTTNGIIVLPADHELIRKKTVSLDQEYKIAKSACCQCNYCTLICPRSSLGLGVQPHKVMQALTFNNADVLINGDAALGCCNCGLCTYVGCNMGLTPSRFISKMRAELLAKKVKCSQDPQPVNLFRDDMKVSTKRVVQRTGLSEYDVDVPYVDSYNKPGAVRIMLRQHIGAACNPVVSENDTVVEGQCIGQIPDKALGACVHASISGRVVNVSKDYIDIMEA